MTENTTIDQRAFLEALAQTARQQGETIRHLQNLLALYEQRDRDWSSLDEAMKERPEEFCRMLVSEMPERYGLYITLPNETRH